MNKRVIEVSRVVGIVCLGFLCACQQSEGYKTTQSDLINTFNKAWNTGDLNLLDETVHPEYFKLEGEMEINGVADLKEYVENFRSGMKGAKITYLEEVHEKDKVAVRFTLEGAPSETKKTFKAAGMVFFRIQDGLIIEDYGVFDQLDALKQQGYQLTPPALEIQTDTD